MSAGMEAGQAPPAVTALSHEELLRHAELLTAALELEGMVAWTWDRHEDRLRVAYHATTARHIRTDLPTMAAFRARLNPADRPQLRALVDEALAAPGIHRLEYRFTPPGGDERWVAVAVQRYLGPEGAPAGLVGVSRDITVRKQVLREHAEQERRLRELSREIIDATSREQERIGHDLHDGLGQELTGIALLLKGLQAQAGRTAPALQRDLAEVLDLVNHALHSTRAIAQGLSPVALERGGLGEGLRVLARQAHATAGVSVRTRLRTPGSRVLPSAVRLHLFRIAQEAIGNAIRHAGARRLQVSLHSGKDRARLRIADDGTGLPARVAAANGLGLRIMQYRAQIIGAKLEIRQRRTGGTAVVVEWRTAAAGEGSA